MNSPTKIVFLCYLVFSPLVLSLPQAPAIDRQGYLGYPDYDNYYGQTQAIDRQDGFQLPENILPVAAVGFFAGIVGTLLSTLNANTTTTTTTTTTTAAPRVLYGN